jgi:hypothetical protein
VVRNGDKGNDGRAIIKQTACIRYFAEPTSNGTLSIPSSPSASKTSGLSSYLANNILIDTWYKLNTSIDIVTKIGDTKVFAAQCQEIEYSSPDKDGNYFEYSAASLV